MGRLIEDLLTALGIRGEKIKIEVGKTYLTKQGIKFKAVSKDEEEGSVDFRLVDEKDSTPYIPNEDGTYSFSEGIVERTFSLSTDDSAI